MTSMQLPQTDSIQALAEFWDTHDLTDFDGQMEEVTEPVFERGAVVRLHLGTDEAEAVAELARAKGVAAAELIREWVLEKIKAA